MDSQPSVFYEHREIPCTVKLQNADLWNQFHKAGTEMIITKSGRRMFPALRVNIQDLDPNAHYFVILEISLKNDCRYKYNGGERGGWTRAGSAEPQSSYRAYMHPDSPALGAHWMAHTVNFNRLKITNSAIPPTKGQHIVLNSMHKYQPKIIIVQSPEQKFLTWALRSTVVFKETQFIAVTAYQNDKITKLKIDNNPFAKGFRENGQARCKRKRSQDQEDERSVSSISINSNDSNSCKMNNIRNIIREEDIEPGPKKIYRSLNQTSSIPSPEPTSVTPSAVVPCSEQATVSNIYIPPPVSYQQSPLYNYYHSSVYKYPVTYLYSYDQVPSSYYHPQNPCESWTPSIYSHSSYIPVSVQTISGKHQLPENLRTSQQEPKKITDFSINAIMNS